MCFRLVLSRFVSRYLKILQQFCLSYVEWKDRLSYVLLLRRCRSLHSEAFTNAAVLFSCSRSPYSSAHHLDWLWQYSPLSNTTHTRTHTCTHIHTHTHAYTHTHTHTHAHTHIYTHTHTFIRTHPHTDIHTHTPAHTHTHKQTNTHTQTHTHKHTHTRAARTHIYARTHTLAYIHTHTCAYTHKHACTQDARAWTHTHTRTQAHTYTYTQSRRARIPTFVFRQCPDVSFTTLSLLGVRERRSDEVSGSVHKSSSWS